MIPIGKFGFIVLNLEMAPNAVDVNVHPAKLEVRFEEDQKVFKAVYYAIQDTLLKAELIANSETKITGKLEKKDGEEIEEDKTSISGLFRKIAKSAEVENYDNNNVIESIYKSKQETQNQTKQDEIEVKEKNENPEAKPDEIKNQEIQNKEQIKNTINEFMQMGQSLTAEQIREKLSALSLANATDVEEKKEEAVEEQKAEIKENAVLEDEEKYETKPVSTEEIEKIAPSIENKEANEEVSNDEALPGNILANIVKERSENQNAEVINKDNFEEKFDDMYEQIFGKTVAAKTKELEEEQKVNAKDIVSNNMNIFEESEEFKDKIPYKFIGIAFKTYIILEIEKELYILDQHAAHERIMYEKVKKNYYSEEEKDSQLMLLPDIITLTHKEMDIARENFDKFQKAGFVLEEFGENTIKLTGVPNICLDLDTKELFLETLDEINTVARTAKQEIEERFIATIACKAAVKANMALTEEEVTSLLDDLLKLPNPFTCPHGRPTAIKLSKTDIEKKFARRQ